MPIQSPARWLWTTGRAADCFAAAENTECSNASTGVAEIATLFLDPHESKRDADLGNRGCGLFYR